MREVICKSNKRGYIEKHVYLDPDDIATSASERLNQEHSLRRHFAHQGWSLIDYHIAFGPLFAYIDEFIFERKSVAFQQRSAIVRMRINFNNL